MPDEPKQFSRNRTLAVDHAQPLAYGALMQKPISLDIEAGNLSAWAEQESDSPLETRHLPASRMDGSGLCARYKKLNDALRAAGITGSFRETVSRDICDMDRLKATAL